MKNVIQSLENYLASMAGSSDGIFPAPDRLAKLPNYFASLYETWRVTLMDHKYILLVAKDIRSIPTPAELAGQYRVAARGLGELVAFVLPELASFARQRLVQYRVPFIVPGRQAYMPHFFVDLREGSPNRGIKLRPPIERLSGSAQALILYYLQKPRAPELCPLGDWAKRLGYSAMTVTRISAELNAAKLCNVTQSGRKTLLDFNHDTRALWEQSLPFLQTPVSGRAHVRPTGGLPLPWPKAGHSALSHYTMLADAKREIVAVGISEYARALIEGRIEKVAYPDEDTLEVERWRYRPEILSSEPVVDRLSLYLSLREDPDERIQAALKDLLKDFPW